MKYFIQKSDYSRVKLFRLAKGHVGYGIDNYVEAFVEEVCEGELPEIEKLWKQLTNDE